ncbi:TonB-dependent receptor plug domain-containing protein [Thiocystis violacea]|uniref:TonB-dependent receptor plug domain-containing protein n=1 Tax=Thiocystis violacea TaxID=13725 RepID=UPI0031F8664E
MDAAQETWRLRSDLRYAASARHFITLGLGVEQVRYALDALELRGLDAVASGMGTTGTTLSDPLTGYASALTQLLSAAATGSDDDGHGRLLSAYFQDEWLIAPKWSLTWGARLDDNSDVGTHVSPRAVLVWTPLPEWTAKLLYGEGFRAPTLRETRNGLLPIYQANADLESERLRTREFAVQYQPHPDLELGLNLFRHETVDQIRQQDRRVSVEPENVGRPIGQGAELEVRYQPTSLA